MCLRLELRLELNEANDQQPLRARASKAAIPAQHHRDGAIYRPVVAAAKEEHAAALPFDTQITIGAWYQTTRVDPLRDRIAAANKYRYTM